MRGGASVLLLAAGLWALGCGSAPQRTRELRASLASEEGASAREHAPDLTAQLEEALDAADAAERRNDEVAAADLTTRARLLWQAAAAEIARLRDEEERRALEAQIAETVARARRDEAAREEIAGELARRQGIRTAREEAERALALAEEDEARPPRQARVSLEEAAQIRRASAALRDRARLTLAAVVALGGEASSRAASEEALRASEAAIRDPREALSQADRAYHAALVALGAARRRTDRPGRDASTALAEAAQAAGFEALTLPEGVAIEAGGLFRGNAVNPARNAQVGRLATLIASHPHGPVQVQVQAREAGAAGEQIATRRAEALRRALLGAEVDADRLSVQAVPASLRAEEPVERARLVFVAYAVAPD